MTDRALYLLTHVASQLAYRWLPPPGAPGDALPFEARWPRAASVEPELARALGVAGPAWDEPDPWLPLIAAELASAAPRLPWLRDFTARYDPGGPRLARAVTRQVALAEAAGAVFLTPADEGYPVRLRLLPDPPHALEVLGDWGLLTGRCVAVVGSRKASGHAVRESFALGRGLATAGYVCVSGGAFGCDIAAHHGVLAAGDDLPRPPAPAVCIFAGGLAELYPRAHLPIFRRLRSLGAALVSERLWESPCRPLDFAARNRLIAGLAPLTVVMQAAQRSGAMVTARLALDLGRDVWVLRHPPDDVRADGSQALLDAGAPGFTHARAVMERLA